MYCAGGLLNELFHFTLNVVRNFSPFNVPLFIINNIVYSLARSLAFNKVRWTGLLFLVMGEEGSRTAVFLRTVIKVCVQLKVR